MRRFPIDLFLYGTELKIQLTCFLFFSWQRNGCILIDNELDVQIIVLCYLNNFHYSEATIQYQNWIDSIESRFEQAKLRPNPMATIFTNQSLVPRAPSHIPHTPPYIVNLQDLGLRILAHLGV